MARRKKRRRRYTRGAGMFIEQGMTLGIGAHVVGKADVSGQVPQAKTAVGKLASFMPVTATTVGAGWAMEELHNLQPKRRRKKRR